MTRVAATAPSTPNGIVRRLLRAPRARVAAVTLLVVVAIAVFAPLISPYDPAAQLDIVALQNRPPSLAHPLGTDPYSRDVLSRLIYGARVSIGISIPAVALSVALGVLVGAVSGLAGGAIDALLMRLVDAGLSIPRLLLTIVVAALWGHLGIGALIALLALTGWFSLSRLVRAETLLLRERDFVLAARALGARRRHILVRHVLPGVASPALVAATLSVGNVILLEAGLSFLGIGVQPPTASWGSIIQDGSQRVSDLWWLTVFPGLAIVITVFACNALADALRDLLDPRQLGASPAGQAASSLR